MPTVANVYRVLIASPGDIDHRSEIASAVTNWTVIHGLVNGTAAIPIRWEHHATGYYGKRPQGQINEQLVREADVVVACFWTRLGTPTGEAESGTVEEIELAQTLGKPVVVYVCEAPYQSSVDAGELARLKEYLRSLRPMAITTPYKTPSDLTNNLTRDLSKLIPTPKSPQGRLASSENSETTVELGRIEKELLVEAAQTKSGEILLYDRGGKFFLRGGRLSEMTQGLSAKEAAIWREALQLLIASGMIERVNNSPTHRLTAKGNREVESLGATHSRSTSPATSSQSTGPELLSNWSTDPRRQFTEKELLAMCGGSPAKTISTLNSLCEEGHMMRGSIDSDVYYWLTDTGIKKLASTIK